MLRFRFAAFHAAAFYDISRRAPLIYRALMLPCRTTPPLISMLRHASFAYRRLMLRC